MTRINNHLKVKKAFEETKAYIKQIEFLNKQLSQYANTDPLTELGNRRSFHQSVDKIIESHFKKGKNFSIVLADIDNFRHINNNYGHNYGDYILKIIASIFTDLVRGQDIVTRWGGEEFLLLFPETDKIGAVRVIERIREKIKEEGKFLSNVTLTYGIAECNHENIGEVRKTNSIVKLVNEADEKMYQGKRNGKDQIVP